VKRRAVRVVVDNAWMLTVFTVAVVAYFLVGLLTEVLTR
jgi:hypothetical protein